MPRYSVKAKPYRGRVIQVVPVFVFLFSLLVISTGCSDHTTGYQQGYAHTEKPAWLLFGRAAYLDGYTEGEMQRFHDDWYAENEDEIETGLSCPMVVMRSTPVLYSERYGPIELK